MRGKLVYSSLPLSVSGITPADAGKTQTPPQCSRWERDHPRGCGENDFKLKSNRKEVGSPPRMRGKLVIPQIIDGIVTITPADAGKTPLFSFSPNVDADHPRGCGEN